MGTRTRTRTGESLEFGSWKLEFQNPISKFQIPKSNLQIPISKFQIPISKFQSPNSKVATSQYHRQHFSGAFAKADANIIFHSVATDDYRISILNEGSGAAVVHRHGFGAFPCYFEHRTE